MRRCVACNGRFPKNELLRIVRNAEGEYSLDEKQKRDGRGAYVCRSAECMQKAIERRGLNRSFRCEVGRRIYEELEAVLQNG